MKRAEGGGDLFPDLELPAPVKPASARRARVMPVPVPSAVVPTCQEWADARYWCGQMLAAADPLRKSECYANMVRCVMALDDKRVMH